MSISFRKQKSTMRRVRSIAMAAGAMLSLLGMLPSHASAQGKAGLVGIGVRIATPLGSGTEILAAGLSMDLQPDIVMSFWPSDDFAIDPSLGVTTFENGNQWRVGVTLIDHFRRDKLSPFVSFRLGVLITSPSSGTSNSDGYLGVGVGGEYFVGEKFSISGEAQLNVTIPNAHSDIFRSKTNIASGVGLTMKFYVN